MNIAVFGWYGTETIGDRGILLGLLKAFGDAYGRTRIRLGSFYPFYTERTLAEDMDMAVRMIGRQPDISLFHSRSPCEIVKAIRWADMVVIGGGPMMHFDPLYMFEFAIRLAHRMGKYTALAACGVGPLAYKSMQRSFVRMAEVCDLVLLRDALSEKTFREIFQRNNKIPPNNIHVICDPAVFCTLDFPRGDRGDYIAVNLRDFPEAYASGVSMRVNDWLMGMVHELAERLGRIVLVPMNHFHVGTDDRVFLHKMASDLGLSKVAVTERILSLEETMRQFADANLCIGMRFHSVLFQTLLNGNNYILDYTDPRRGKIAGFVEEIGGADFYADRYVALQVEKQPSLDIHLEARRFELPGNWREDRLKTMVDCLKRIGR